MNSVSSVSDQATNKRLFENFVGKASKAEHSEHGLRRRPARRQQYRIGKPRHCVLPYRRASARTVKSSVSSVMLRKKPTSER